ncbi:MAG: 3-deoxy-D-manno-octulosonic acid transferase [Planctomycetota bacterium]|nr:3-deoxy-D-manno-octulosonic acid transferase [Planctomycetota bacterium]
MKSAPDRASIAGATIPPPILSDPDPGFLAAALYALYDLAWVLAIVLPSPWWLVRAATSSRFRATAGARLGGGLPRARRPGERGRILVHGVSVGEVKAAQALVRELRAARPDLDVVVSTVTTTGFDVARKLYPDATVVRFPFDLSFVVRRFLRRVGPDCVVLVELEVWPSFLREANRAGIPIAVVNGRITERSYRRYLGFKNLLPQFARISLYCAQDAEYAQRFVGLGAEPARVLITGNVKADALRTGARDPSEEILRRVAARAEQIVLVAGSTHAPEEAALVRAWRESFPAARLVLVPRHPERSGGLARELGHIGPEPQFLTRLRAGESVDPARPLVVDTIGELEQIYAASDLVFVGGSLIPHGGQNMLEPAAQGRAVVYGPHVGNFLQEAGLLERAGAAVRLAGEADLGPELRALIDDPGRRRSMGAAGRAVVEAQKGATALTLRALVERVLLRPPDPSA